MKRTLTEMLGLDEAQTPKWPQVTNNLKSLGMTAKKLIAGAQSQNQAATLNATSSALRILARMLESTMGLDNGKRISSLLKLAAELVEAEAEGAPTEGEDDEFGRERPPRRGMGGRERPSRQGLQRGIPAPGCPRRREGP